MHMFSSYPSIFHLISFFTENQTKEHKGKSKKTSAKSSSKNNRDSSLEEDDSEGSVVVTASSAGIHTIPSSYYIPLLHFFYAYSQQQLLPSKIILGFSVSILQGKVSYPR